MGREIEYRPEPRKRVPFSRLQEILAKHAPKADKPCEAPIQGESESAVCKTSESLRPMRWRRRDMNTIESDAGYAVHRCVENGVATGRFLAFKVLPEFRTVIGGYDSGDAARAACEAHRQAHA